MINDETKRKLRELGLDELINMLNIQDFDIAMYSAMPFDERLDIAVDGLYQQKNNTRSKRLMKQAHFRFLKADVNDLLCEPWN